MRSKRPEHPRWEMIGSSKVKMIADRKVQVVHLAPSAGWERNAAMWSVLNCLIISPFNSFSSTYDNILWGLALIPFFPPICVGYFWSPTLWPRLIVHQLGRPVDSQSKMVPFGSEKNSQLIFVPCQLSSTLFPLPEPLSPKPSANCWQSSRFQFLHKLQKQPSPWARSTDSETEPRRSEVDGRDAAGCIGKQLST